jgi:RNA polymerase sigma-70 factor (ECF subfamily)
VSDTDMPGRATHEAEVREMGMAALRLTPAKPQAPAAPSDERSLVRSAAAGDRLAFRALYERTAPAAYRMALRIARRPDLAEEVVQEAFCQAWAGMRTFKGESQFGTWVLSIARHVALDALRRAKTRKTVPAGGELLDTQAGREERADERLRGRELGAALEAALAELPEESRTAFMLAALEKLPYAEVAAVLGTTSDGVKCRVFRVREHLRARLARFEDGR